MKDKLLGDVLKNRVSGFKGLSIEIKPLDKEQEDAELKKEGLAPAFPAKDQAVKAEALNEKQMPPSDMDLVDDDEEIADSLVNEDDQDDLLMMAMENKKPKGLHAKAEQVMVAKKALKKKKD